MIKVVPSNCDTSLEPAVQLVKRSSRGLINDDRRWLVKRASSDILRAVDDVVLHPGEQLIHLLALSTTEATGNNRNGDGFRKAACVAYHNTFVKHARFYRDHLNKDPSKSYGRVVASAFNDPMHRVELLVALNGSEKAAARNGGLLADREMEKLASDNPLAVSMSCAVPFDLCSFCGNKAKNRTEYCRSPGEGGSCRAGGLMRKIGQLVEVDGRIHALHADNTEPTFFDISHVYRPADRTAYVTGLLKAASAEVICGELAAELAGIVPPLSLLKVAGEDSRYLRLTHRLAAVESEVAAGRQPVGYVDAFENSTTVTPGLPKQAHANYQEFLGALHAARAVLPLASFIDLATECGQEKAAAVAASVRLALPGVYTRLLLGDVSTVAQARQYEPRHCKNAEFLRWATQATSACTMTKAAADKRLRLAAIRTELRNAETLDLTKTAAAIQGAPVSQLATHYALYKLAFLGALPDTENEALLTDTLVVLQNYAN